MNNREKLDMLISNRYTSEIISKAFDILKSLSDVPDDMMPPEVKKLKTGCLAFCNRYVETLNDFVDIKDGIIKSADMYTFYPNGMMKERYCDFSDLGLKPWTPSKKSQEEYEQLKAKAKTVAEEKAEQGKIDAKKEARRIEREKKAKEGNIRLGDIKSVSSFIYWQLKKATLGAKFKFPKADEKSLHALSAALTKCKTIILNESVAEQKRKAMQKMTSKYCVMFDARLKPYLTDGSIDVISQCQYSGKLNKYLDYGELYVSRDDDGLANIIPGKEQEFIVLFKRIAQKIYKYNTNPNDWWRKSISQGRIMDHIIRYARTKNNYCLLNERCGVNEEVIAAAKLLEFSRGVKGAICNNDPNAKGLTPFLRDFLIKINAFDIEEVAEEEAEELKGA